MRNVPLSDHSSYRIGGPAEYFAEPKSEVELTEALDEAKKKALSVFILGGGTNILFSDAGFKGLVLKPAITTITVVGEAIHAGGGALMKDVVAAAAEAGLSGLEWAGGLPGTLGGAIRGNAGAFGGEMKDSVARVRSMHIGTSQMRERSNEDCHFAYRSSVFKERDGTEIVLLGMLNLRHGDKEKIRIGVEEKIAYRKEKHPMDYPNVGSIFKNVDARAMSAVALEPFKKVLKQDPFPVIPTAYLLSETGLKGVSCGGAMFSPKHPNFIVNVLEASAADVRSLIELAKGAVKEKFDIVLEEEVMYV